MAPSRSRATASAAVAVGSGCERAAPLAEALARDVLLVHVGAGRAELHNLGHVDYVANTLIFFKVSKLEKLVVE